MNDNKHTEGPWFIQNMANVGIQDINSVIIETGSEEDDLDICKVYTDINGEADAHLIAAAPEMLIVLGNAKVSLQHPEGFEVGELALLVDQITTIINKAKGA